MDESGTFVEKAALFLEGTERKRCARPTNEHYFQSRIAVEARLYVRFYRNTFETHRFAQNAGVFDGKC